jgi:hypothetical protein
MTQPCRKQSQKQTQQLPLRWTMRMPWQRQQQQPQQLSVLTKQLPSLLL